MWWLVSSRDHHQPHQNLSSGRHILPAFFMVNDQAVLTGLISY
jgi:Na+-translocating ferredoxin:NAD+ oxidoreductase RnfD subunit